jgi:hypothetical protein
MTEVTILVLSLTALVCLVFIGNLFKKISKLQSENNELKRKAEDSETKTKEIISIDPGDKAIIPNYGLTHTDTKHSFDVTYEVMIVEVSIDKVKVKAIDFNSSDKFGKDPKNKSAIIDFMKDKWIAKKDIELIVDDQMRREAKLNQILN